MKKSLVTFLNKPKLVGSMSLIIAIALGTWVYVEQNMIGNRSVQSQSVGANGTFVATSSPDHLTLGFTTSGRIQSIAVQVGQAVKKGDVLASLDPENTLGAMTQAKAAYMAATANYEKVLNGASGPTIDVAKAAVQTAQTNLDTITKQQNTLVENARRKLFSDNLVAQNTDDTRRDIVPTISGAYSGTVEGKYTLYFRDVNDLTYKRIAYIGLEKGVADKSDLPQPLGTLGLQVAFPESYEYQLGDLWTIEIPNKSGANYAANLNAYQAAVQTHDQAIAAAQSALTQAQASLASVVATARPEDVAAAQAQVESARGALQIAEAAYNGKIITAPADGTVTAIHITPGQIASQNGSAIELSLNAQ